MDENDNALCAPVFITIVDISNRGAKLSIGEELAPLIEVGSTLKIYLCFIKEKGEAVFNARVRWLRSISPDTVTAGVEYFDLSEESKDYLEYFFSGPMENALHVKKRRNTRHIKKAKTKRIKKVVWVIGAVILGIACTFLLTYFLDNLSETEDARNKPKKELGFIEGMMLEKMKSQDMSKEDMKKAYLEHKKNK
ncbi:MAG: PilZ domain-containing protein [Planctomycetota bacterium]